MFSRFDIEDKNVFKTCVVATMSSGKSTFINSIIGEEILPEQNEACTARTMAVLDNDAAKIKKAHIIRKNGAKEVVEINNREILDRINNDEDIEEFLIEANIQSIKNTDRALLLIDTPGVNNSGDQRHGERTEALLKQMDFGVIIYLLNATQLATNDDSVLLQMVSNLVKKQNGNVKIMFVINKIDAVDVETESIRHIVQVAKEYIENHGIESPIIYPLSALAAKILRMAYYRKEMTRREQRKLDDIYRNYKTSDNNMLAYAVIDEVSSESFLIGEEEVSGQDLLRAIENTGINAIEKKLSEFMNEFEKHFSPKIVIKTTLDESVEQKYHQRLKQISWLDKTIPLDLFKAIRITVNESEAVQVVNRQKRGFDEIVYHQAYTFEREPNFDFGLLIEDIEKTKKIFYGAFVERNLIWLRHSKSMFFIPEEKEEHRVTTKVLYTMSVDKVKWQRVEFGEIVQLIENGNQVFFRNEYTNSFFRVNKDNYQSIIAFFDIKLPYAVFTIGNILGKDMMSVDEISKYVKELETEEQKNREEIKKAQEQLKRTYKGVLFDSVKEKERIIQKEEKVDNYCNALDGKGYLELWNKKEEISKLPSTIFAPYVSKIITCMNVKEKQERADIENKIQNAQLDELSQLLNTAERQHYSDNTVSLLKSAVQQRTYVCQKQILEADMVGMEALSRADIKKLISKVQNRHFDEQLTKEFVHKLDCQFDFVEETELNTMCRCVEDSTIPELEQLQLEIKRQGYQEKFQERYIKIIDSRIEYLHIQNMEMLCADILSATRNHLAEIKTAVDSERCREELKQKFYQSIEARKERLDYEELCELTSGIEDKSLEELECLYETVLEGAYYENIVKPFVIKIRKYRDKAQYKYVNELTKDVFDSNKNQLRDIKNTLAIKQYPDRIVSIIQDKINARVFELDMLELINLCNSYDQLDLHEIDRIASIIEQKVVLEECKNIVKSKLKEREHAIALMEVSPFAHYFKRLHEKYGILNNELCIATISEGYESALSKFIRECKPVESQDIPIIIMQGTSYLALTRKRLYYKENAGVASCLLNQIQSFGSVKKLLFEGLVINFANGSSVNLAGTINKKCLPQLVMLLNEFIMNMNNPVCLESKNVSWIHVENLNPSDYSARRKEFIMDKKYIARLFLEQYQRCEQEIGLKSSIKYLGHDRWGEIENKIKTNFGLVNETALIWYYDRTFLNSAKEGISVGLDAVHIKKSNQSVISIPWKEVVCIEVSQDGNGLAVTAANNCTYIAEILSVDSVRMNILAQFIDDYMKGIQLVEIELELKNNHKCTNCGAALRDGARFCPYCGTKVI